MRVPGGVAVGAMVVLLAGCVDTEKVFVERDAFENPPAGAGGFLGYVNSNESRPVCGNCHVGQHSEWQGTAHAGAWETLQESGHAQASCEGCHTVGANGNAVTTESVGYAATGDARYHDVQCESCHGPGLAHVTNPDASQPLASIEVGPGLESGCGECHQGTHNPFVEEWAASRHGKRGTSQQESASCVSCHEARGVFAAWGVKADYLEKLDHDEPVPITCAVCHDPHDASNPRQLRFPIDVADVEQNLCMKCHHKRAEPELTNHRSPHSPQGPLLLGAGAGWIPPDFTYEPGQIVATHGTERNPRLCAGCHVNRLEVLDPATGGFVFNASGHLFKPIPCLDAQGLPTADENCTIEQRSFKSCTASGCHGSEATARSILTVARGRIGTLTATLDALLAQVPASEFDTGDNRISTAEGARFNSQLAAQPGSPIHNPFLVEALLTASIKQVRKDYGLVVPPGILLDNVLSR